ncbi:hypothetical protein DSECCO2_268160 [anaerobic digester metagenome]
MSDGLLMAIASVGEMSLSKFDEAFTEICLKGAPSETADEFKNIRRKAVRLLDALGVCEFDFGRNKVFSCPPALVLLPGGGAYRAVMTGVRSPKIMEKVTAFVREHKDVLAMTQEAQGITVLTREYGPLPAATLPSAVIFESLDKDVLAEMAHIGHIKASIDVPAAWGLASFSVGLHDYREHLSWDLCRSGEPTWVKSRFSPELLKFTRGSPDEQSEGLVEYIDPVTYERRHWFWDGDRAAVVDRDWGRYLTASRAGRRVLVYDDRRQLLAVPASLPLPRFLARAATLCSGTVPTTANLGGEGAGDVPPYFPVDIYAGVPPEYMSLIASKLGQRAVISKAQLERCVLP